MLSCYRSRVVAALLTAHTALVSYSAYRHGPAGDEPAHLASGISHWQLGTFDLYRVNPPLVRLVAALPVLALHPQVDWTLRCDSPGSRAEFAIGFQMVRASGEQSLLWFRLARCACIPFSLIGAWICYAWGSRLYGSNGGLVSLVLWSFCPVVLGHAALTQPDVAAAGLGASAVYIFWRWLAEPVWFRALACGIVLGLAELTKSTWLILFPLLPLLWGLYRWPQRRQMRIAQWLGQAAQGGSLLVMALFVLNLGYGFEGSFERLDHFYFVSDTLGGPSDGPSQGGRNRFAGTWLGHLPVPLPRDFVLGVDAQKHDFEQPRWSYLRGEWRQGGWWYYYLYGLAVKLPLGIWLLAALAALANGRTARRDELILLAPGAAVLVLVSSQTGFNHHVRYVLPALPLFFIWLGRAAQMNGTRVKVFGPMVVGALAWVVITSLWYYPHSLSYFNELAGGPAHGPDHLVDSNIDCGQDLLFLRDWIDRHPEARPLALAYYGPCEPRAFGMRYPLPPFALTGDTTGANPEAWAGPSPGWYAVSVTYLRGCYHPLIDDSGRVWRPNRPCYAYFLRSRPVARAGYSIYIYHLSAEDCNSIRRELALPGKQEKTTGPFHG